MCSTCFYENVLEGRTKKPVTPTFMNKANKNRLTVYNLWFCQHEPTSRSTSETDACNSYLSFCIKCTSDRMKYKTAHHKRTWCTRTQDQKLCYNPTNVLGCKRVAKTCDVKFVIISLLTVFFFFFCSMTDWWGVSNLSLHVFLSFSAMSSYQSITSMYEPINVLYELYINMSSHC